MRQALSQRARPRPAYVPFWTSSRSSSQEIHELKDQIQDVEAKHMQSLKEVKVPRACRVQTNPLTPWSFSALVCMGWGWVWLFTRVIEWLQDFCLWRLKACRRAITFQWGFSEFKGFRPYRFSQMMNFFLLLHWLLPLRYFMLLVTQREMHVQ